MGNAASYGRCLLAFSATWKQGERLVAIKVEPLYQIPKREAELGEGFRHTAVHAVLLYTVEDLKMRLMCSIPPRGSRGVSFSFAGCALSSVLAEASVFLHSIALLPGCFCRALSFEMGEVQGA